MAHTRLVEHPFSPEWIEDHRPDSPFASAETVALANLEPDPGHYHVAEVDGQYVVYLSGSHRPLMSERLVRHFITHTERFHTHMARKQQAEDRAIARSDWHPYEIADAVTADATLAQFDPARSSVVRMIGAGASGLKQAQEVGRFWANLDRTMGLGSVCLDTQPTIPGRPGFATPGVAQLKLIELPDWHADYMAAGDVAVVYYRPVTTYVGQRTVIGAGGAPEIIEEVRASSWDPSGYVALVKVVNLSPEQVDEFLAQMRQAVRVLAGQVEDDDPNNDAAKADDDTEAREKLRRLSQM